VGSFLLSDAHPPEGVRDFLTQEFGRRFRAAKQTVKVDDQFAEFPAARRTFTPGELVLAPRLVRIGRDFPSFRAHGCFSFLCQESKRILTPAHPYLYQNPPKIGGSLLILIYF
jgi:hypothetical protein